MTAGISVINIVLYEHLDMGIKVECDVGERKTLKAQEDHKQGSGRRNLVHQGPSKRVSVAGQRGLCGNEAKEVDKARPCWASWA